MRTLKNLLGTKLEQSKLTDFGEENSR